MTEYLEKIKRRLEFAHFLQGPSGVYGVVDGQYGSTGKGLAVAVLAETLLSQIDWVTSNAGPNSGHTSYYNGTKIVLKQLPTITVQAKLRGVEIPTLLNAGAVIDADVLLEEVTKWGIQREDIHVHSHAAIISKENTEVDKTTIEKIGSTGKGIGPSLQRKVSRLSKEAVVRYAPEADKLVTEVQIRTKSPVRRVDRSRILVEVSQGYSLGINSGFYPYTTARECTMAQAMADAQLPLTEYRDCMMVVRTFPIRVAGNSGPCYPDQHEISWGGLGQEPELTTVTQKVRRVFTWSDKQFMDAVAANRPSVIFLNFCNYLDTGAVPDFVKTRVINTYQRVMGIPPRVVLCGFGPRVEDVRVFE